MVKFSKLVKRVLTCVLAAATILTSTPAIAFASDISETPETVETDEELFEESLPEEIEEEISEEISEEESFEEVSEAADDAEESTEAEETSEEAEIEEAADESVLQAADPKYIVVTGEADDAVLFTEKGEYPDSAKYLQKDITVTEDKDKNLHLKGTLNCVSGYTAFDSATELQRGYYAAVHFATEVEGTKLYAKVLNPTVTPDSEYPDDNGYEVTNDCFILRIGSKEELASKGLIVTAVDEKGAVVETKNLLCDTLKLNAPELTATGVSSDEEILGEYPGAYQQHIYVADEKDASYVYGKLTYMSYYPGFSSDEELQKGYFLSMHFETTAPKLYVKYLGNKTEMDYGGSEYGYDISYNTDGNVVYRIANAAEASEKGFELTMCDEKGEVLGTKKILCSKLQLGKIYDAYYGVYFYDENGNYANGYVDWTVSVSVNGKEPQFADLEYMVFAEGDEYEITVSTNDNSLISRYAVFENEDSNDEANAKDKAEVERKSFTYKGIATKGRTRINVYGPKAALKYDVCDIKDNSADMDSENVYLLDKETKYKVSAVYDTPAKKAVSFDFIRIYKADGKTLDEEAFEVQSYGNYFQFVPTDKATAETYTVETGKMVDDKFVKEGFFKVRLRSEFEGVQIVYNGKTVKNLSLAVGEYVIYSLNTVPEGANLPDCNDVVVKDSNGNAVPKGFYFDGEDGLFSIKATDIVAADSYVADFVDEDSNVLYSVPFTVTPAKITADVAPVITEKAGYQYGYYEFEIALPKGVQPVSDNGNKVGNYVCYYTWGEVGKTPSEKNVAFFEDDSAISLQLNTGGSQGEYELTACVFIPAFDEDEEPIYVSKTAEYVVNNYYATKAGDMKVTQKAKKAYTGQTFVAANIKYADKVTFRGCPYVYFEDLAGDLYECRYDSETGNVYITLDNCGFFLSQFGKHKLTIEADAPYNAIQTAKKTITVNILPGINDIEVENSRFSIFKNAKKAASSTIKYKTYYTDPMGQRKAVSKKVAFELDPKASAKGITVKKGKINVPKNFVPSADFSGYDIYYDLKIKAADYESNETSCELDFSVYTEKESIAEVFLVEYDPESDMLVRPDGNNLKLSSMYRVVARDSATPKKDKYDENEVLNFYSRCVSIKSSNKAIRIFEGNGLLALKPAKNVTFTVKFDDGSKVSAKSAKYNFVQQACADFGLYSFATDKMLDKDENELDYNSLGTAVFAFEFSGVDELCNEFMMGKDSFKVSVQNGNVIDIGKYEGAPAGVIFAAIPKSLSKPMVLKVTEKKSKKSKKYTVDFKDKLNITKVDKLYSKSAAPQKFTATFEIPEELRDDPTLKFKEILPNPVITNAKDPMGDNMRLMAFFENIRGRYFDIDETGKYCTVTFVTYEDVDIAKGKYKLLVSFEYKGQTVGEGETPLGELTIDVVAPKKVSVKVPKNGATISMDKNECYKWNITKKTKNLTALEFNETLNIITDGKINKFSDYFKVTDGAIYLTEAGKNASAEELKANSRGYVNYTAYNGTCSVYGGMYVTINVTGLRVDVKPLWSDAYGCKNDDLQEESEIGLFVDGVAKVYGTSLYYDGTENDTWKATWPEAEQKGYYLALKFNAEGFAEGECNIEVAKMENKDSKDLKYTKLTPVTDDFCVFFLGEEEISYNLICIRVTDKDNKEVEKLYLDLTTLNTRK
ncbi:MAG: hypothetical protein MJ119_02360 [Lachnospiraceae bacterium]|nr:hypothetical protein [Lachnospiraceae bacterium]